jgi:hypothetical protein
LNHVYTGDEPPFKPVAVNVTVLPEQTELDEAEMDTEGEILDVTESVIPNDVAVVADRQAGNAPPTSKVDFIISPLDGEKLNVVPDDCNILFLNQV